MVVAVASPALAPAAVVAMRDALLRMLRLDTPASAARDALGADASSPTQALSRWEREVLSAGGGTVGDDAWQAAGAGVGDAARQVAADEAAEPRELAVAVLAARLRQLPAEELLVLSLRYERGLTWPEVSAACERSRSQVRRLHDQALRRLEAALLVEAVREAERAYEVVAAEAAG